MKSLLTPHFLLTPLLSFLLSRLWVGSFVYLGHSQRPYLKPVLGGWEGVHNWWLNPWTTYDSELFFNIAHQGYTAYTAPVFPLYPLLLRLAGKDPLLTAVWGMLLSNLAFLLALLVLYRLVEAQYDVRTARIMTWLTALLPAAPFFSAVYSESVFLLFFATTLWYLREKKWLLAAVCGFLAAWTRSAGLLIFIGLFIQHGYDFFQAKRHKTLEPKSTLPSLPHLLAIIAPLIGFLTTQLYIAPQVGDATQSVAAHQQYFRALTWPWQPILLDFWDLITLKALSPVLILNLGATVLALLLLWKYRKELPISYSVMLICLMMMQLVYSRYSIPRTQTSLRLLATSIPFLQALTLEISRTPWSPSRRFMAIALCLLITAFSSYVFGLKQFLG
jgi:Gpi18-like mannosyltransferase